jgi:hypothetical protein
VLGRDRSVQDGVGFLCRGVANYRVVASRISNGLRTQHAPRCKEPKNVAFGKHRRKRLRPPRADRVERRQIDLVHVLIRKQQRA